MSPYREVSELPTTYYHGDWPCNVAIVKVRWVWWVFGVADVRWGYMHRMYMAFGLVFMRPLK